MKSPWCNTSWVALIGPQNLSWVPLDSSQLHQVWYKLQFALNRWTIWTTLRLLLNCNCLQKYAINVVYWMKVISVLLLMLLNKFQQLIALIIVMKCWKSNIFILGYFSSFFILFVIHYLTLDHIWISKDINIILIVL